MVEDRVPAGWWPDGSGLGPEGANYPVRAGCYPVSYPVLLEAFNYPVRAGSAAGSLQRGELGDRELS